jgi:hypothetical protein
MAGSRETIPAPAVVLPLGEGRVEITVVNDEIWLSDYANDKDRNFTMVIPRSKLTGNKSACDAVHNHYSRDTGGKPPRWQRLQAVVDMLRVQPPRMAGYWYQDPASPAHGGPVVIVEE